MVVKTLFKIMTEFVIDKDIKVPENFIPEEIEEMLIKSRLDVAFREITIKRKSYIGSESIGVYGSNEQLLSSISWNLDFFFEREFTSGGDPSIIGRKHLEMFFGSEEETLHDYCLVPSLETETCGCSCFFYGNIMLGALFVVEYFCSEHGNYFYTANEYHNLYEK